MTYAYWSIPEPEYHKRNMLSDLSLYPKKSRKLDKSVLEGLPTKERRNSSHTNYSGSTAINSVNCETKPLDEVITASDDSQSQPTVKVKKNKKKKSKKKIIEEPQKFKTEICKNWSVVGSCKYGKKCQFAHGNRELKNDNISNVRYKSKLCKSYHSNEVCYYGVRCQFIHEDRSVEQIQQQYASERDTPLELTFLIQRPKCLVNLCDPWQRTYSSCLESWLKETSRIILE